MSPNSAAPNIAEHGLYDRDLDKSSCGVGFLTRKDGVQTHEILLLGHEALCAVPHRGGMSAEGVGDGAGVSVDLSLGFFSGLTGQALEKGRFGVGNFFLPDDAARHDQAAALIGAALAAQELETLLIREVPVDPSRLRPAAIRCQQPIRPWIFTAPEGISAAVLDLKL